MNVDVGWLIPVKPVLVILVEPTFNNLVKRGEKTIHLIYYNKNGKNLQVAFKL